MIKHFIYYSEKQIILKDMHAFMLKQLVIDKNVQASKVFFSAISFIARVHFAVTKKRLGILSFLSKGNYFQVTFIKIFN